MILNTFNDYSILQGRFNRTRLEERHSANPNRSDGTSHLPPSDVHRKIRVVMSAITISPNALITPSVNHSR